MIALSELWVHPKSRFNLGWFLERHQFYLCNWDWDWWVKNFIFRPSVQNIYSYWRLISRIQILRRHHCAVNPQRFCKGKKRNIFISCSWVLPCLNSTQMLKECIHSFFISCDVCNFLSTLTSSWHTIISWWSFKLIDHWSAEWRLLHWFITTGFWIGTKDVIWWEQHLNFSFFCMYFI